METIENVSLNGLPTFQSETKRIMSDYMKHGDFNRFSAELNECKQKFSDGLKAMYESRIVNDLKPLMLACQETLAIVESEIKAIAEQVKAFGIVEIAGIKLSSPSGNRKPREKSETVDNFDNQYIATFPDNSTKTFNPTDFKDFTDMVKAVFGESFYIENKNNSQYRVFVRLLNGKIDGYKVQIDESAGKSAETETETESDTLIV